MLAAVALLALSVPVHASEMDDRIELSARKSHVFKTYWKFSMCFFEERRALG
jgi:hypothetical protein